MERRSERARRQRRSSAVVSGSTVLRAVILGATLAVALAGCARMANTREQEIAWRAWKQQCQAQFPSIKVERVYADGRVSFSAPSPDAVQAAQECLRRNRP